MNWVELPSDVVVDVVFVTLSSQLFGKRKVSSFLGNSNIGPWSQRSIDPDAIVIYLISST
jgi:hypothetical protein